MPTHDNKDPRGSPAQSGQGEARENRVTYRISQPYMDITQTLSTHPVGLRQGRDLRFVFPVTIEDLTSYST